MDVRWPFAGRVEQRRAALTAVETGSGFILIGPCGVGRTRLLGQVVDRLDPERFTVIHGFASPVTSSVSLGAFAHALPGGALHRDDQQALFSLALERLTDRSGGRTAVLAVDDLHHLDPLSLAVIHSAVSSGHARLAGTLSAGAPPIETITALRRCDRVVVVPVEALDRSTVATIGGQVLGGHLDEPTALRLWELSSGNARMLREIIDTLRDQNAFRQRHGVWSWTGDTTGLVNEVTAGILRRLEALGDPARRAVEAVALADYLDQDTAVALTGPAAVDAALDSGLIRSGHDRDRITLRPGTPLDADVTRHHLAAHHRIRLITALVGEAGRAGDPDLSIRFGRWHLDYGVPVDTTTLVNAARIAHGACDLDLSRRLADAALAAGAGFPAIELSALARGFSGDQDGAIELLAGVWDRLTDDAERIRWAQATCLINFDGRHDPGAVEELRVISAKLTSPDRDTLDALAGCLAVARGDLAEAERELTALATDPGVSPSARHHSAAMLRVLCAARGLPDLRAGYLATLAESTPHHDRWPTLRATVGLAGWHTIWVTGEIAGLVPESRVARVRVFSIVDIQQLLAHTVAQRSRGLLTAAAQTAATAVATADRGGRSFLCVALAEAAHIAALAGDRVRSRSAMADCDRLFQPTMMMSYPVIELARVAVTAVVDGPGAAATAARDLGARLAADGLHGFARHAWHIPARLGLARAGDLDGLAASPCVDAGPLVGLITRHTRAVIGLAPASAGIAEAVAGVAAAGRGPRARSANARLTAALDRLAGPADELRELARSFAGLGLRVLAVEAATQRYLALRAGRAEGVGAAADELADLLWDCDESLRVGITVPGLTTRETEISEMAAGGMTPAMISTELVIERRSVESHIYRLYRKLGVNNRKDLPGILRLNRLLRDRETTVDMDLITNK